MPRLGGVAVVCGFLISIIYLLISLTLEKQINLVEGNYHFKTNWFLYWNDVDSNYLFYG